MRTRLMALCLLAAASLATQAAANAAVVRCNDADGNTLYTDSACPAGMKLAAVPAVAQSCATEECERRRERDLADARERLRADKEQLIAATEQRHRREIEDRWIDEARYEAELRSAQNAQPVNDEVFYPGYPVAGFPFRCGKHCLTPRHHHRPFPVAGNGKHPQHHMNGPGNRPVHAAGNESIRRPATSMGRVAFDK